MKYLDLLIMGILFIGGLCFKAILPEDNSLNKGVYYDNFQYTDNVLFKGADGLNLDYSAELNNPGDYYELDFDVVNSTNYDIEIADYFYNESDNYIEYELCYGDGSKINNGDVIKAGEVKRLKYKVSYKSIILDDNYEFDSSFSIQYEQAV